MSEQNPAAMPSCRFSLGLNPLIQTALAVNATFVSSAFQTPCETVA